jgi:hypothetical protein
MVFQIHWLFLNHFNGVCRKITSMNVKMWISVVLQNRKKSIPSTAAKLHDFHWAVVFRSGCRQYGKFLLQPLAVFEEVLAVVLVEYIPPLCRIGVKALLVMVGYGLCALLFQLLLDVGSVFVVDFDMVPGIKLEGIVAREKKPRDVSFLINERCKLTAHLDPNWKGSDRFGPSGFADFICASAFPFSDAADGGVSVAALGVSGLGVEADEGLGASIDKCEKSDSADSMGAGKAAVSSVAAILGFVGESLRRLCPAADPHQAACDNLNRVSGRHPRKKSATGRASALVTSAAQATYIISPPTNRYCALHGPHPTESAPAGAPQSRRQIFGFIPIHCISRRFPCFRGRCQQTTVVMRRLMPSTAEYHTVHNQPSHFQPSSRQAENSKQKPRFPRVSAFPQPFMHKTFFTAPAERLSISSAICGSIRRRLFIPARMDLLCR